MRVRFAPSPTGYLHVGGARTALFNWLLARREGGVFVLRIEDTDRERSSAAMTDAILDGLRWLGLDWDEGPLHQADGLDRHRADAFRLLANGNAYRCFCSQADIEARRGGSPGDAYRYDRHCLLHLTALEAEQRGAAGQPFAVRFHVPDGNTAWSDAVYGDIEFGNADIEDFIILRSDGTPIYNLAVVSDDVAMAITHVIRGDDHISNTPKQIMLYRALGRQLPTFAHVPMILGPDGRRLSKRHGATAIGEYRQAGILPDAMVNFLALLGWSPGTDEEIFTSEELVKAFSIRGINRKSAVFDPQKLLWFNARHLNRMSAAELAPLVTPLLLEEGLTSSAAIEASRAWYFRLLEVLRTRARTIRDFVDQARPYFTDRVDPDPDAVARYWKDAPAVAARLRELRHAFQATEPWNEAEIEGALRGTAERLGTAAGKLIHPLRVALTGAAVSPGIFEVAALLGRERVLRRIEQAESILNGVRD